MNEETGAAVPESTSGPAVFEKQIEIRASRGHVKNLRFWFAPVSEAILNADADWLEDEELSCDNLCMHELFMPFIRRFFKGTFRWRNEINLMKFKDVRKMTAEIRRISDLLESDYDHPDLTYYKKNYSIDLLVSREEYARTYLEASDAARQAAVREHVGVITAFYLTIADYLDEMTDRYKPLGFHAIAICAPS